LVRLAPPLENPRWPVGWARRGEWDGRRVVMVADGMGGARASGAVDVALASEAVDTVVSVGFCGALDPSLQTGDIFVADQVQADGRVFPARMPRTNRRFSSGSIVSMDHVVITAAEKRELRARGAAAVEMEAGGVAARATARGLPFYCIRSVTDTADESFQFDFNSALRPDGSLDTWRVLRSASARPVSLLPELLRLRKRGQIAAQALGEFIVDCRL